jgi:hypothetical protein
MKMKVEVFKLVVLLVCLQCNPILSMTYSSSSESHLFLHEMLVSSTTSATTTTIQQQKQQPRFLNENEDKNENNGENDDNDDDYFSLDEDSMLDFSGFSLKYAKCQTIQRFSEDAIKNGEYSAMVKEDIVILRLCPNSQCTSNKQYGCRYNYLEYAISLFDYLKFMLKYTIDKKSKLCDFCQSCGYFTNNNNNNNNRHHRRRRRTEGEDQQDEANNERQQEGEDQAEDNNENNNNNNNNNNQQEGDVNQDNNAAADADANADADDETNDNEDDATSTSESSICESYSTTCSQTESYCLNGGASSFATVDDDDTASSSSSSSSSSSKLPYNDYFDYLGCVKIVSNGANYWIRPRCDPYKDNIHMDIYYDPYCSQYAGNDVNLREVSGINFQQSVFTPYYNGTCIDCSSSVRILPYLLLLYNLFLFYDSLISFFYFLSFLLLLLLIINSG